jgi:hypothetical protein
MYGLDKNKDLKVVICGHKKKGNRKLLPLTNLKHRSMKKELSVSDP